MKALLEIYLTSDGPKIAFLSSGMTESICRQNAWCYAQRVNDNDGKREIKSGRIVDVADELVAIWDGDDLSAIYTAAANLKLVDGILHCKATSDRSDDLISTWNASDAAADYEARKKLETEKRSLLIKSVKKMYEDTEARGYYGPIAGSL